jgi:glyoxylase-like metal-dependent hydrolase (beta-lactamase superfamily II)
MKIPVLTAALALSFAASAQQDAKEVQIKTNPIAPGVAMLEGMGGNIGVLYGDDGVFVIDDQFAPLFEKIRAAVGALSQKPIRFVFNTHWHMDHTGGNLPMGEAGAVIVAHDNVRKRLSAGQFMRLMNREVPPAPPKALPVVTFADSVTFHLNGETVEAVHLPPAHTDGDVALYLRKANVLHGGDCFVNNWYPIIDVDSGGSVDGLLAAQEKMLSMVDEKTKIIPGHGPLGDRAALQAAHDMLKAIRDAVKKLIDEGKSLDEVKAAKVYADFDEKWGKGFIKGEMLTAMIYGSLKKN